MRERGKNKAVSNILVRHTFKWHKNRYDQEHVLDKINCGSGQDVQHFWLSADNYSHQHVKIVNALEITAAAYWRTLISTNHFCSASTQ